jgi:hypothetical protein
MVSSRLVFSRFLWPVTGLMTPCSYSCAAPLPGRKRARPTTPSVEKQSRNWTNFELLRMGSRNLQRIKDLAIAAGRPDIGTGARPLLPDGRGRIDK